MTESEMDQATEGLKTKSDKIRALARLGVARAEIATYLNIRYQHVRNVLVAPTPARQLSSASASTRDAGSAVVALTIDDAKRGLAANFRVAPEAIEIIIRG